MTLLRLWRAERVKVVVRVRPPQGNETGGAVAVAPDSRGVIIYREWVALYKIGYARMSAGPELFSAAP